MMIKKLKGPQLPFMSFKGKRIRSLSPFWGVLGVCLASCTSLYEDRFDDLLENNVIWSDQENRITISVFGPSNSYGYAVIRRGDENVSAEACFSGSPPGIYFRSIETLKTNVFDSNSFNLEFKKADNSSSVVLTTTFNFSGGESYRDPYEITLTKRTPLPEEMDWKRCVGKFWISEDKALFLSQNLLSPFTGEVDAQYNGEKAIFTFLDDSKFKIEQEDSLLAAGQYISLLEGLDLVFDAGCGKELFGERMHLSWSADGERPKVSQA